jgi:hypothetical protein
MDSAIEYLFCSNLLTVCEVNFGFCPADQCLDTLSVTIDLDMEPTTVFKARLECIVISPSTEFPANGIYGNCVHVCRCRFNSWI